MSEVDKVISETKDIMSETENTMSEEEMAMSGTNNVIWVADLVISAAKRPLQRPKSSFS